MTHDPLACADLIATRRYAYGKAAADDGDWAAAAEMFEQALEQAPNWPPAWFALGEAREKLDDLEGAADAFRATLAADPSDTQGATARLALIGAGSAPYALPQAYVARLFDDYAPRFNAHLTEKLAYRGPELIAETLEAAAPGRRFSSALDVGCGTGLMAEAIRKRVDRLTGVDLSPAMVAKARQRGLYDALEVGDATAFLRGSAPGAFDCILAADTFCYFGDLKPILAACVRALAAGGLFAFTTEIFDGDGFQLQANMRFAHARGYVETLARDAGLRPLLQRAASTRREAGTGAPGLISVFQNGG
jgi:predicted TPR repeat methyltransferase